MALGPPKKPHKGQTKEPASKTGRAYSYRFNPSDKSSYWKQGGKLTQAAKDRQKARQSVAEAMGWVKKGEDFSVQKLRVGDRGKVLRELGLLPALEGKPGTYDPNFVLKSKAGKVVGPPLAPMATDQARSGRAPQQGPMGLFDMRGGHIPNHLIDQYRKERVAGRPQTRSFDQPTLRWKQKRRKGGYGTLPGRPYRP